MSIFRRKYVSGYFRRAASPRRGYAREDSRSQVIARIAFRERHVRGFRAAVDPPCRHLEISSASIDLGRVEGGREGARPIRLPAGGAPVYF
jgi:hypothetical protein